MFHLLPPVQTPLPSPSLPVKYCENERCRATSSPLWRKGWVNPVTGRAVRLCNACGLHFRKRHFCEYCCTIYREKDGTDSESGRWLVCQNCERFIHAPCEEKHCGVKIDLTTAKNYCCNECKKNPDAVLTTKIPRKRSPSLKKKTINGNVLDRGVSTNQNLARGGASIPPIQPRAPALAAMPYMLPSPVVGHHPLSNSSAVIQSLLSQAVHYGALAASAMPPVITPHFANLPTAQQQQQQQQPLSLKRTAQDLQASQSEDTVLFYSNGTKKPRSADCSAPGVAGGILEQINNLCGPTTVPHTLSLNNSARLPTSSDNSPFANMSQFPSRSVPTSPHQQQPLSPQQYQMVLAPLVNHNGPNDTDGSIDSDPLLAKHQLKSPLQHQHSLTVEQPHFHSNNGYNTIPTMHLQSEAQQLHSEESSDVPSSIPNSPTPEEAASETAYDSVSANTRSSKGRKSKSALTAATDDTATAFRRITRSSSRSQQQQSTRKQRQTRAKHSDVSVESDADHEVADEKDTSALQIDIQLVKERLRKATSDTADVDPMETLWAVCEYELENRERKSSTGVRL